MSREQIIKNNYSESYFDKMISNLESEEEYNKTGEVACNINFK